SDSINKSNKTSEEKDSTSPVAKKSDEDKYGKTVKSLDLIRASYKEFKKADFNPELLNKKDFDDTRKNGKKWYLKSSSPPDPGPLQTNRDILNPNMAPYYSKEKKKSYASIPFRYSDNNNSITKQGRKRENSRQSNQRDRNPHTSPDTQNNSRRSSGKASDSQRSSYSHSQRSPTSSKSSRRSPSRHSQSKRRRLRSPHSRQSHDGRTYTDDEKALKEDHAKELKLFIDVPEVHPDFENKYRIFSERYELQFPGKNDSTHKEQKWLEFWKVVVTGLQELQWEEKIQNLKVLHRLQEPSKRDLKDVPSKRKSSTLRGDEAHKKHARTERETNLIPDLRGSNIKGRSGTKRDEDLGKDSDARERRNSTGYHGGKTKETRSSSTRIRSSDRKFRFGKDNSGSLSTVSSAISESLDGFSMEKALESIQQVRSKLGVLSPALKIVIEKVYESGINSRKSVNILTENDTLLLIDMCIKRLDSLDSWTSEEEREMIMLASSRACLLKKYLDLKIKEFTELDSEAEAITPAILNKKNPPKVGSFARSDSNTFVDGIDVSKIARATHNKGTVATIEFIKNALAYEGIANPSTEQINNIYLQVSKVHFQMTLSNSSSLVSKTVYAETNLHAENHARFSDLQGDKRNVSESSFQTASTSGQKHTLASQFQSDKVEEPSHAFSNPHHEWKKFDRDRTALDFMNERLDFLLEDVNLQGSSQSTQNRQTENVSELERKKTMFDRGWDEDYAGSQRNESYSGRAEYRDRGIYNRNYSKEAFQPVQHHFNSQMNFSRETPWNTQVFESDNDESNANRWYASRETHNRSNYEQNQFYWRNQEERFERPDCFASILHGNQFEQPRNFLQTDSSPESRWQFDTNEKLKITDEALDNFFRRFR
ncbi:hypothetical protein SK128_008253, partial [Halocaridina rubra]